MMHQKKQLGGFVALNTGHVANCYSKVDLRHTVHTSSGGFCGENRGVLDCCAAQGRVQGKGKKSGFCRQQKGKCSRSIWLRKRQTAQQQWADWEHSVAEEELAQAALDGWDFEAVWHLHDDAAPARLGLYDRPPEAGVYEQVVEIRDRKDLMAFARQINDGKDGCGTLYRLMADIDLGGRTWTPVGLDANTPFEGCFDGGGHQIRDFTIHADKYPFAGFFGCVGKHGAVQNLRVDCVLLGKGSAAAPLCANNSGEIINCVSSFHGTPSRYTGGLVAQNGGRVSHSAALGRFGRRVLLPWWIIALLLVVLCVPVPAYFSLSAQTVGQEVFAPVILDPNAKPIAPEEEITPAPTEDVDTSASFVMNTEMAVSTENYAGSAGLRCPAWSTRGFVATVRVSQADLEKVGYETAEEWIVLYQSGLIAPGYGVDVITLGNLPDGTGLPVGEYALSVLLEFYDMETNEKSAVNTEIPLEVTVR